MPAAEPASSLVGIRSEGLGAMNTVARVTEISAESDKSFEDAVQAGLKRAGETLRGIKSAWIKEQSVQVNDGHIASYRVDMLVTFLLDD